jgi:hypothetical protein
MPLLPQREGCARALQRARGEEGRHGYQRIQASGHDARGGNQLEGWLEWAGYEVCGCPGPGLPTTCPQIRGRSCPLTRGVDLVVLDLELRGDFGDGSPPSWVLLDSYLERGSRVVALADPAADPPLLDGTGCTLVPRGLDERQLLATVRRALAR